MLWPLENPSLTDELWLKLLDADVEELVPLD